MALIQQEVSTEREIEIPDPVRAVYRAWRPTPLYRARRLEQALDTPAKIYYKYEGASPSGSHKPNTAVAQAFYNKEAGVKRITTETGAGQWGSALAIAGSFFDLEIKVFMVRVSFQQKPYRKAFMQAFGAQCVPSPSEETTRRLWRKRWRPSPRSARPASTRPASSRTARRRARPGPMGRARATP
jgi:tryptophan synthase beta chain